MGSEERDIGRMAASDVVISALRGKILEVPDTQPWTPYNANLSMQGIRVLVKDPLPKRTGKDSFYEDTMMLLDIVREEKLKEIKQKRRRKSELWLWNRREGTHCNR